MRFQAGWFQKVSARTAFETAAMDYDRSESAVGHWAMGRASQVTPKNSGRLGDCRAI
ncbi:hypothetical protein ACI7BZ_12160 [Xanthobacter sp. AM11]|uniref:hypothetical protein n=1 Tax=Xanthobacter sp. AM11 TaxID=3380643 RepID=UPI0039BFFD68